MLFRKASHATIIAPFIKTDALRSLLDVIPARASVRCVTRWLPAEVAAGVSDLEVLDVLEVRGAHELLLVDRLHAKLYIADNHCLAGSANVTRSGLGETNDAGNIEILVDTDLNDPAVVAVLRSIESDAIPATRSMADAVRRLAEVLPEAPSLAFNTAWHPVSRHPEQAYRLYSDPPTGFLSAADRTLLADIARSNLSPGLHEREFRRAVRATTPGDTDRSDISRINTRRVAKSCGCQFVPRKRHYRRLPLARSLGGIRTLDVVLL